MPRTTAPKPLPDLAIKRAAFFFLGLDLLAFFYYVVGSLQGFLENTQLMLLGGVTYLSTAVVVVGLGGLILYLVRWIGGRNRFSVLALVGWIACVASGAALALFSSSVAAFAAGI